MRDTTDDAQKRSFWGDERAIEGLPIRLVIALVVGVAAMGVMMNVLGTFDFGAKQEVEVEFNKPVIDENGQVKVSVVDENGENVTDSTVIVRSGKLSITDVYHTQTGPDSNSVTINLETDGSGDVQPDPNPNQETGTLEIDVVPPSSENFADKQENSELTVVMN